VKRPLAMIWAEGFLDRVAAERLAVALGLRIEGSIMDAGGIDQFWKLIGKYNQAAQQCGLVFALADHDGVNCVGPKLSTKLRTPHQNLVLRLCVAELESWMLADAQRLGAFLSVSPAKFPTEPDKEHNPKRTLVNLAAQSSKPSIKAGMVPMPGRSTDRGPEYTLIMESFIRTKWRPSEAAKRSPSLARAIRALELATNGSRR